MFMNKKVLTLCAGFLLAGGLNAFAEKLPQGGVAEKLEGGNYYLVNTIEGNQWVYGFEQDENDPKTVKEVYVKLDDDSVDPEDFNNYLWTVTEKTLNIKEGHVGYVLKNVATGRTLTFTSNGTVDCVLDDSANEKDELAQIFHFKDAAKYDAKGQIAYDGYQYGTSAIQLAVTAISNPTDPYSLQRYESSSESTFQFYKEGDREISEGVLNELYNSTGFNLVIGGKDKVDNIFVNQRVKAIEVKNSALAANGAYAFPVGTYFITETPADSYASMNTNVDRYNYLRQCTFIAVSPSTNDINDAKMREEGKGFQLVTISGDDLNKYVGENNKVDDRYVSQGEEISVYNACFSVYTNSTTHIGISLDKFRYNKKADSEEQTEIGDVVLNVTAKDGDDHGDEYLTTDISKTPAYIFDYKEAFSVKATTFLNENAKAVYTIQFVSGTDKKEEVSEEGKYLFAPAYDNGTMYAKGAAFVETDMPEAQWLITDIDEYNVTFTNRANNDAKFTAKLYAEEDGAYSLAIKDGADQEAFNVLNVDKDGNMSITYYDVDLHQTWVKLEQVSTDKFAGTWNVADETEVTMLFARDNTPTSNKLYVHRELDRNGNVTNMLHVSNKLADALQFQLVKSEDSLAILNNYAYKVGDVVKYASLKDTVAFYTYKLQAFQDGVPAKDNSNDELFLAKSTFGTYYLGSESNAKEFVIKDNVDGSVALIEATTKASSTYETQEAVVVNGWKDTDASIELFGERYKHIISDDQTQEMMADYVKTYLNLEAPEVSLDTDKSYVVMKSEVGETYVQKNDENDAIIAAAETPMTLRVFATDTKKEVPSFYIATDWNENGERMFMFNPEDSVNYYVAEGEFNKKYQWDEETNKVIFKKAYLDESLANLDTLVTEIKGQKATIANKADDNKKVQGGLDKFKFQIVLADNEENLYWIRQNGEYLTNINGKLTLAGDRTNALKVEIADTDAPTANESINAAEAVQVVAANGAVIVKGAEGKNVVVSTILGKVVANEVLNSDNETIAAPAGIVVVSVDGESFKVAVK